MTPKRKPVAKATPLQVAMKNVREVLEKDKSTGWQPRVQSWAAGSKKLDKLMLDPAFSYGPFQAFSVWAEDELAGLITSASVKVFLNFFLVLLEGLYNQRLKPILTENHGQSHEENKHEETEASPAGIAARIGKTITLIAKSIQQVLLEERTETNAKELYTKQWLDMLIALLDACMSRNMRNEELECILCEIVYHIASSSTTDQGRQLLKADEVLGFERLGSYLYKSDVSRTSVLLLRLLVCLLPALATKLKDERAIAVRKVIGTQRWDTAVRKDVFPKIGKIVDVYWPDQLMITINALAEDKSHVRPRAYQVTSLLVDMEDQLESSKSKRYIETGQLIIYLDRWTMVCVAYDDQGSELDIFFYLDRIIDLVRGGSSGFNFRYKKEAGGQVEVRLEIRSEQADDFFRFANMHLKTMKNNSIISAGTVKDNAVDVPAMGEIDRLSEQDGSGGLINKTTQDTSSLEEALSPSIFNHEDTPVDQSEATVPSSTQSQVKTVREVQSETEQTELRLAEISKSTGGRSKRKAATAAEINVTKQLAGEISLESDPNSFEQEHEDIEDTEKTPLVEMNQDLEGSEQSAASNASTSEQLATQDENTMTGSARKSDKAFASRAALRPKTIVDSDSDPDDSSQPPKEPIPAAASKINLAKSKPTAKSSTFKTPKPRSSAPVTLHNQIKQGLCATPASTQASKSKGRGRTKQSDENAEDNESEIGQLTLKQPKPPKTLFAVSKRAAVAPMTPRKLPAKSRSQHAQESVEDDTQDETEKHPPLPWESEAVGVNNMPKSRELPRTTESRSAPFPAGSIAAAEAQSLVTAHDTDDHTQFEVLPETASSISPPVSPGAEGHTADEEAAPETLQDNHFLKLPKSAEIPEQTVELAKNVKPHNTASIKGHPATSSSLPILPSFAAQVGSSSTNSTNIPAVNLEDHDLSATNSKNGYSEGNRFTKAARLNHQESDPLDSRVVPQMNSKNSSKPPKTSAKNTKQNPSPPSTSIIGKKRDLATQVAEEDETQSIDLTPRPVISRKSVEAMFRQQEEVVKEQEDRVSKKARIALLPSSSIAEEDVQPAKPKSRENSGGKGSVDIEKEKGRKRKSAENSEKNDEGKISRRRSSGSADIKALNESERLEQRAMNEFDATFSQITDLIRDQSQNRLKFPSKQAKVAKSQFGKLAKNLIDDLHKESKNQVKILHSRSQIAHDKYENWRKTDIATMLNIYKKTKVELDEVVGIDKKKWEFKEVLFS